jgi:general secretion pathway protein A
MSYYRILGFEREPFSTSPDPEFFYSSREHERALTNVLIELRLRRGLSVVLGDVGTGKTTLSRKLVQDLRARGDCLFHMMLDPSFESRAHFLRSVMRNFGISAGSAPEGDLSITTLREEFERFLFEKGIVENKTVILVIDEAQKLDEMTLEELRLFLNYETNQFKLLQLVLLGQSELLGTIKGIPNFHDRISFKTRLNPLDYRETAELIHFRIRQGGFHSKMDLFLEEALREIYQYTSGYPRQVTMLCHRALKELVLRNKTVVDREIVKGIIDEDIRSGWQRTDRLLQKNSC